MGDLHYCLLYQLLQPNKYFFIKWINSCLTCGNITDHVNFIIVCWEEWKRNLKWTKIIWYKLHEEKADFRVTSSITKSPFKEITVCHYLKSWQVLILCEVTCYLLNDPNLWYRCDFFRDCATRCTISIEDRWVKIMLIGWQ